MKNRQEDLGQQLSRWLDDEQTEENDAVGAPVPSDSSEAACGLAADEMLVHGLLRDQGLRDSQRDDQRIVDVMRAIEKNECPPPTPDQSTADQSSAAEPPSKTNGETTSAKRKSRHVALASLAAALAAVFLLMFSFGGHDRASAAMVSLKKIIEVAQQRVDRSYRLSVVEEYRQDRRPRDLPPINGRRKQDDVDGAVLHVRSPDEFVFVRRTRDGRQRVSGCDGRESWAFREDGPVHVSGELSRFRGGLPGDQQQLPFINLHTHLKNLTEGYDVVLRQESESSDGRLLSELIGTRKSADVRGPKWVAIRFDAKTGVVYQMVLDQLPRRGGGPKSVSLELLNPEDLGKTDFGPDFFSHDSHHEPLRQVRFEEAR